MFDRRFPRPRRVFLAAAMLLAACGDDVPEPEVRAGGAPAERIYLGGDIVTMNDAGETAGALAIADGLILAVGDADDVLAAHRGAGTVVVDLAGKALLPGFIDAHGHFLQTGLQASAANLLPPPDGTVASIGDIVAALEAQLDSPLTEQMGVVLGMGYDDAQLAEGRHPTRDELAAVDTELPILLIHQSGHLGVANDAALELAGIGPDAEDPAGGAYRRDADGRLTGVMEETAFFAAAMGVLARINDDVLTRNARASQRAYAAAGFTTAQEGRATLDDAAFLTAAGAAGILDIDVAIYPDPTFAAAEPFEAAMAGASRDYRNRVRLAGIKLSLDGSPQGKTAWLTAPYYVPPQGQDADYRGYGQLPDDVLDRWVGRAFEAGWQVLTHVNGDAAIDQFLGAVERATAERGEADRRPVAIHAQTAREDQVARMGELGIIPSFMTVHTFYWGDWHRDSVLGPERAARISPHRDALSRGMVVTSHNDAPVTLPNSRMILFSQVNRTTRSGAVLGPGQRVSTMEALRAITIHAAYQHFEEDRKGSLEPGKLADLVILDRNPLTIAPEALLGLEVVETIKEGATIFRAE